MTQSSNTPNQQANNHSLSQQSTSSTDSSQSNDLDTNMATAITQSDIPQSSTDDNVQEISIQNDSQEDNQNDSQEGIQEGSNDLDGGDDSDDSLIEQVQAHLIVIEQQAGIRIDKVMAQQLPAYSRAQLQGWLNDGNVTVNGTVQKPKYRVKNGDVIDLQADIVQHGEDKPENIPLEVIYEDDSVVVINKPVGMVVHPGAGNWTGTLVNALLYHYPNQAHLPRAGLVHRIDKDTSGLLIIGKTKVAQMTLQAQLKDKNVYRHYRCVVAGEHTHFVRNRIIDAPIGRHRQQRIKMTVTDSGKDAVTHITGITPLGESYSLLDIELETGRTHQIRVHLSHLGYPIIGDSLYGNRSQLRAGITDEQRSCIMNFPRQALHAYKLGFAHPDTGEEIVVEAPLPEDMVALIDCLS